MLTSVAGGTYKFRIAAVYSNNDNKIGPNSKHFHLALLTNPELHPPKVKPKVVEAKPITYQNIYAIGIKWQVIILNIITTCILDISSFTISV